MPLPDVALIARARGIAAHLIDRATLDRLAGAETFPAFVRRLRQLGPAIEPIVEPADIDEVDRAIDRTVARHLRTLQRWRGRRPGVLDVVMADLDRRAVRALVRGAVQGAPAAARLDGLLPTPTLPERALRELARAATALDVVTHLILLAYPDASELLPIVRAAQPDLLAVDAWLLRQFARRAQASAAHGDETLRQYVRESIDVGNVTTALVAAGAGPDGSRDRFFVEGGSRLSRRMFAAAVSARSAADAAESLRQALAGSPLGTLPFTGDVAFLERAHLVAVLRRLTRIAAEAPLSSAAVLCVLLRNEAQSRDLRAIAWGAALGVPVARRRELLVTP